MFSGIVKQVIRPYRLSRTIHLRNFNPSAIKLCRCIGVYSNILQSNLIINNTPALGQTIQYSTVATELSETQFIDICEETLQSLYELFEEIADKYLSHMSDADIMYEGGILKVDLGSHGTYIINRQTPNKQIWLSSPKSGPKRYDYIKENNEKGYWIYKHDGITLHSLLQTEINSIIPKNIDFSRCAFSKL